jgi:hypothetical protein
MKSSCDARIHGYGSKIGFLAALADPENEDHATMVNWIGGVFNPRGFDLNRPNREWRVATAMRRSR